MSRFEDFLKRTGLQQDAGTAAKADVPAGTEDSASTSSKFSQFLQRNNLTIKAPVSSPAENRSAYPVPTVNTAPSVNNGGAGYSAAISFATGNQDEIVTTSGLMKRKDTQIHLDKQTYDNLNREFLQPVQQLADALDGYEKNGGFLTEESHRAYLEKVGALRSLLDGRKPQYYGNEDALRAIEKISEQLTELSSYSAYQRTRAQVDNIVLEGRNAAVALDKNPDREDAAELRNTYYNSILYRDDFEEDGKPVRKKDIPFASDATAMDGWDENTRRNYLNSTPSGEDLLYETVNGNYAAALLLGSINYRSNSIWDGMDAEYKNSMSSGMLLYHLTDEERSIFNYVYKQSGLEPAKAFLNYLAEDLSARNRLAYESARAAEAKKNPVLRSIESVVETPFRSLINAPGAVVDSLDLNIQKNAPYMYGAYKKNAIRNTVTEEIDSDFGKWAYQTGMSIADSQMRSVLSSGQSGLSSTMVAGDAYISGLVDGQDRGLEDWQTIALAGISAAAEIGAEFLKFDKLFNNDNLTKGFIRKYIMENMATEGLEEMTTEGINTLADILISQDKSQWQQSIDTYKRNGKTDTEAWMLAIRDKGGEILLAGASGAVSGGVMSGGYAGASYVGNYLSNQSENNRLNKKVQSVIEKGLDTEGINALIESGLESDVDTDSHRLAEKMKDKVDKGKTPTNKELADLLIANEQAIQEEQTERTGDQAVSENQEAEDDIRLTEDSSSESMAENPVSLADKIRQEQNNGGIEYEQSGYEAATAQPRTESVFQWGADLSDGSPERLAGTGTGEQTGRLGGSPAQSQKRSGVGSDQATIGRQNRAKHLQKISSLELGLETGTDAKNLRLMPQELWDDDMTAVADRIYNETGKQVQFVLGKIQVKGASGAITNVRGVFTGDGIIVQADNSQYSISQIADHEAYHVKASPEMAGQGLNQAIRQHIIETFSEEELNRVVNAYLVELDGVYDISGAKDGDAFQEAVWAVEEEIFADAYAGINAFGTHADKFTEAVNEKMDSEYLGKQTTQENGTKETTGPPRERYSVEDADSGVQKNTAHEGGGAKHQGKEAQYKGAITQEDVDILRLAGRKSINAFTSQETQNAQKWAHKFYNSFGVKSPFFRAWFGEWRENSNESVSHVIAKPNATLQNGRAKNKDTDIEMSWNAHDVLRETGMHAARDKVSKEAVNQLPEIVENAVLLDTVVSMPTSKSKMKNTAFMHSFYAVYNTGNEIHLLKLYAEMALNNKGDTVFTRAYQLKDIKKVAVLGNGVLGANAPLSGANTTTINSIADLVDAVKQFDPEYSPNPSSKVINADGTPKVVYHGSYQNFSVFDGNARKQSYAPLGSHFFTDDVDVGYSYTAYKNVASPGGHAYKGGVYECYLNIRKPHVVDFEGRLWSDRVNGMDINGHVQYAKDNGYDGVIAYNIVDEGGQGDINWDEDIPRKAATDYIVFSSEQIKSATDNIGTFDGSKTDIRYSVDDSDYTPKSDAKIQAELDAEKKRWEDAWLRDRLGDSEADAYLQRQKDAAKAADEQKRAEERQKAEQRKAEAKKKAEEKAARNKQAREELHQKWEEDRAKRTAKEEAESRPTIAKKELRRTLLDFFSIPVGNRGEIATIIDQFADRLIREGSVTEESRKALFDRLYQSGVMTIPAEEVYQLGRGHVTSGRIYVNDSVRAELGDDWNTIRKRAFAAGVYLTNDPSHSGIDSWNSELAELLPGLFDPGETDLRMALERIVQVAEDGKDEKVSLPEYTARLAGIEHVSEDAFLDHMERKVDEALRTFAKSAELEIHLKKKAIKDRADLSRSSFLARQKLAQEREQRKEMSRQQQEQKELRELQQRTLKNLQWLSKNRNRMPEDFKQRAEELLGDLDILAVGAANEMRWSDRYNATWRDAVQMYKDAQEDGSNFIPSKDLADMMMRLNNRKIADLDVDALSELYRSLTAFRKEYHDRNNLLADEMNRIFSEVYADSKSELQSVAGAKRGKVTGAVSKFFNLDQLTPMNVAQRMVGWDKDSTFYSMVKMLEKGEQDVRAYVVKSQRIMKDFLTEHKDWVKKADGQGKDCIWYDIEVPVLVKLELGDKPVFGETVKISMTPAQKVHLYLESKNTDNLRHIAKGGRRFVDKALYSKGMRQEAFEVHSPIKLAPETVKSIVSNLTAEEMELARVLEIYYNSFAKTEMNRISNILLGYDKAIGKFYAPICTDPYFRKTQFGVEDGTAEGASHMQSRSGGTNATYNISAFDAFENHVDEESHYVGMAIPTRNWEKFLNWGGGETTLQNEIAGKWGGKYVKYFEELLKELQGKKAPSDNNLITKIVQSIDSASITATFGFNEGIVAKQLGSIPMAAPYLDWKNFPKLAQIKEIDRDLIGKYTQELDWRTLGYSTPETKFLKDNPNWTQSNEVLKFLVGGDAITAMDGWAASTLWPWAENKVRRDFPDLEIGSQELIESGLSPFYKKVAEVFNDAVSRSQSVSDIMHQSTMRRSNNIVVKTFTRFKSDSAQSYNALRQKIGEAIFAAKNGDPKPSIKAARNAAGSVVLAMIINNLWAGLVDFLKDLRKQKGKNYRDEDGELTWESVLGGIGRDMFYGMAGTVVFAEEFSELIGTIVTDDRWYEIDAPGIDALIDLGNDIYNTAMDIKNGDIAGAIKEVSFMISRYFVGFPADNIEGWLRSITKWVCPQLDVAYEDMLHHPTKDDLSGLTGESLKVRLGNLLSRHGMDASDEAISALAKLYEDGHTSAVPSDTPTKVTINGEDRTLSAHQQQVFGEVWSNAVGDALEALVTSEDFQKADEETQAKMLKALYDHGTVCAKAELFEDYVPETSTFLHSMTGEPLALQIGQVFDYRGMTISDDVASALAPLYENGFTSAVPSAAPDNVTVNGDDRKLSAEQKSTYNQVWSDTIADALGELVASKEFQDADEETQAKMLKALYDHGTAIAQTELFEDYELESGTIQTQEIVSAGASLAQCVAWNKTTSEMKAFEKADLLVDLDVPEDAKRAIFQYKISESREDVIAACDEAGVKFDQFLEVYSEYGEINAMDLSATQKATEFAYWLDEQGYSESQAAIIKDGLTYFNMTPASASQYEKFVDAGMDADDAYELVQDLNELEPIGEADDVTDLQRWRTCVEFSDNENVQMLALAGKMRPEQFAKVQIAYDFDISPDTYVTLKETLPQYDADGNGSLNQGEVKAAVDSMRGLTTEERAVLWQLSVSTKSAKNNPYSTEIGQQVLDAKG